MMKMGFFSSFKYCALALCALMAMSTSPSQAGDLAMPSGKTLLTVVGKITNTNVGETVEFDRDLLQAMGMHTLNTTNPFIQGTHTFEGILFSDLLDAVGATGTTVAARALDGFVADIPIADLRNYPVIIAMNMDGKVMSVRSKGPLWVIYPVDQYDELKAETYSSRSIWQLTSLTIK